MVKLVFATLVGLVLSLWGTQDQYVRVSGYTGNELLKVCESGGENRAFCVGYIEGVSDGLSIGSDKLQFDMPQKVTMEQMTDIVVKYLKNNPEIRDRHAAWLIQKSFEQAFPVGRK
jgi:hypothetical protein